MIENFTRSVFIVTSIVKLKADSWLNAIIAVIMNHAEVKEWTLRNILKYENTMQTMQH